MAEPYTGYVTVDVSSYEAFRSATLGNGYDVDGSYGDQCWDFAALFYYNAFNVRGYPLTGNGNAYGCWTINADANTLDGLTQVTNISDIKRGDLIVLNYGRYSWDTTGHIAFADEDYDGTTMTLLGQNQVTADNPFKVEGYPVTATSQSISAFLGGWRYDKWSGGTPTPTPTSAKKKHHFPWAVFGTQVRNRMYY